MSNSTQLTKVQQAESRFRQVVAQRTSPDVVGFARLLSGDGFRKQLALALPKHITPERMIRVVTTALHQTPDLLKCEPTSIIASIIRASQLGLEPDGVMGQAYLVPFKDQCQLIIGYRGLISLALRSGKVTSVRAEVVHENDFFEQPALISDSPPVFRKNLQGDRGRVIAVFALARLDDKTFVTDTLTLDEVEKARKTSRMANGMSWRDHYDEMAKKTAVRRLAKYLPQAVEFHSEAVREEYFDSGVMQDMNPEVAELAEHTEEPKVREPGEEG